MLKRLLFALTLILTAISFIHAEVIFEAEDANISAGKVDTKHAGYTGEGFADTENMVDVYLEWTINAVDPYNDSIGFRYALGSEEDLTRSMQLWVNDVVLDTMVFDNTTEWTNWVYEYATVPLVVGENKIKLVAIQDPGGPNIDHLKIKFPNDVYFKLTTEISGDGSIAVLPVADSFQYGTRLTLTATPDPGNILTSWGGDASGTLNPLKVVMDKDRTVSANFAFNQPAFPGAEGFGALVTGGRGGKVIQVTNLNDNGAGSLRAALQQSGSRTIVFTVSGTIYLSSKLSISNGDVTIAGQTAPGDGITIAGNTLTISANNVIIRYIRARLGDINNVEDDAMNGRNNENIILDHCTLSWSVDETGSFYDNKNFTMQYCILSESLYNSVHGKGQHGYGGIWGGQGASFHHNLLAHHTSRNPRFCGSRYTGRPDLELVDFRNNVIYNWGGNSVYGAEGGSYNLVNNYYKMGPATSNSVRFRIIAPSTDDGSNSNVAGTMGTFFVDGNYVHYYDNVTEDNWIGVQGLSYSEKEAVKSLVEYEVDSVTTQDPELAFEHILAHVGASLPVRDTIDNRIIQEVISGTATYSGETYGGGYLSGIIDSQTDVGGWPELNSTTPPVDTDADGMPDDWETANGLDPNDPLDRNGDLDGDGYTNLEAYLNSLVEAYTYIIRPINFALEVGESNEFILTWDDITETETGFYLERQFNDGEFTVLADLPANTETYTDTPTEPGDYTYRLRSYNDEVTSLYTDIVDETVDISPIDVYKGEQPINVYPNPFDADFTVSMHLNQAQTVNVSLLSLTGQTVFNDNFSLLAGDQDIPVKTSALPQGIYIVSIKVNDGIYLKKLKKN